MARKKVAKRGKNSKRERKVKIKDKSLEDISFNELSIGDLIFTKNDNFESNLSRFNYKIAQANTEENTSYESNLKRNCP